MLNSVFKDAIKRREKTLEILKGPKFEQIKEEAKSNWIENFKGQRCGQLLQCQLNQMEK